MSSLLPISTVISLAKSGAKLDYTHRYNLFARVLKRWIVTAVTFLISSTAVYSDTAPRLMILGDSLTAGYGLPQNQAFPVQLEAALRARGNAVTVINAGVSGDTTAGGLARLDWALASKPTHVLVELGANDMLRAVDPDVTRKHLDAIIEKLKSRGIKVMLAGMYATPNLGKLYIDNFRALFTDLSQKHTIMLYPFFLSGVAAVPRLNLEDGMHPNGSGVAVIVERMLPSIEKFLGDKE